MSLRHWQEAGKEWCDLADGLWTPQSCGLLGLNCIYSSFLILRLYSFFCNHSTLFSSTFLVVLLFACSPGAWWYRATVSTLTQGLLCVWMYSISNFTWSIFCQCFETHGQNAWWTRKTLWSYGDLLPIRNGVEGWASPQGRGLFLGLWNEALTRALGPGVWPRAS